MTLPRAVIDRAGPDPGGPRRRRALHEEERPGGAVRIPLHHHRAIADVRQQHRRDVGVVLNQVALGDAALGPERLAQVREAHLASARWSASRCRRRSGISDAGHALSGCELRRTLSVPHGAGQRHVRQLERLASTQRSISPPRLMSPRPTKAGGNIRRSPKIGSSTSTYLPDAMLPSSTTSQSGPTAARSARAPRSSGRRYAALLDVDRQRRRTR